MLWWMTAAWATCEALFPPPVWVDEVEDVAIVGYELASWTADGADVIVEVRARARATDEATFGELVATLTPTPGATCATDGEWCATTVGTCTCDGVWVCDGAAQEAVVSWDEISPTFVRAPALTRVTLAGTVQRTLRLGGTGSVEELFVGRNGEVRALTSADKLFRLDPALDGSCSSTVVAGVTLPTVASTFVTATKRSWLGSWGTYAWGSTINTTTSTPTAPAVAMSCGGLRCP